MTTDYIYLKCLGINLFDGIITREYDNMHLSWILKFVYAYFLRDNQKCLQLQTNGSERLSVK